MHGVHRCANEADRFLVVTIAGRILLGLLVGSRPCCRGRRVQPAYKQSFLLSHSRYDLNLLHFRMLWHNYLITNCLRLHIDVKHNQ